MEYIFRLGSKTEDKKGVESMGFTAEIVKIDPVLPTLWYILAIAGKKPKVRCRKCRTAG